MKVVYYGLLWCAALSFTWNAFRSWTEVAEIGFAGVLAVKAVCFTFLSVTSWFGVVFETKGRGWRRKGA